MNNARTVLFLVIALFLISPSLKAQQPTNKNLDRIVAVVNDHIILKSEVDQQVQQYMMQMQKQQDRQISFGEDIWYTVLQNIVDQKLMLDQAKLDSVTVSDEMVDQNIDRRIQQSVEQLGSEEALEQRMGQSIVQLRADLRENYREQMVVQRFQQKKRKNVEITRPEVREYFENIPQDSLPTVPEQVAVSQIVTTPPPSANAKKQARQLATQLRDSVLNHGKTIEEMAKKYSDGPSASKGGKLPLVSIDDLVAEYSAAATALKPGEISKVVETSFGFHVIRLNKRSGDKIDTNHILISVDDKNYNDQAAKDKLRQIKDSIQTNDEITFAEMARKHSDDSNTAAQGGRILNPQNGQRLMPLESLEAALYRIVLLLEEKGDISEPKKFQLGNENNTKRAFRIVQLNERVAEHTANIKQDYSRIKQAALREKQQEMVDKMLAELRKEMFVEYKISIPEKYKML
ncbi:periplasmic chaperone for outer membrane proteins SurA [Fodinibius salinus]|uniref:Periplasmic chaperone for outer membrane proteins SurA n=1 Tax=Fodinibius salinus TaxID=860790 RepID=A0A5D3YQ96_9BACT|nr:peptidylprolyl isomerase [Fodinibius salinus]TYP95219.1 periplasmic chaperone for outer membrane proteins SurA [Fodinibius salinus]